MTIKEALLWATKKLNHSTSAGLDAEVLLAFSLNKTKEWLLANPEYKLKLSSEKTFKTLVKRRGRGEPIAYLTGTKEFYGYNFKITKDVLVPRPLTEKLVSEALKYIQQTKKRPLRIADIGTGSGCIIIALAKKLNTQEGLNNFIFYATDISPLALRLARCNAKLHGLIGKMKFFQGSLLQPLQNKQLDLILANLPYLSKTDFKQEPSIQKEPRLALIGDFYPQLFKQAAQLKKSPLIIYEDLTGIHSKR